MRSARFALVSAISLFSPTLLADHLPPALISHTTPEAAVGSIKLDKTSAQEMVKRLGEPSEIANHTDDKDVTRGERSYIWRLRDCKLKAWTWFQPGKESPITAVDVWGHKPNQECTTGNGLKLGASLGDLQHLYGRFQQGRNANTHLLYVHTEWPNGTEADIDFDAAGKINHIQIGIDTE